MKKPASPSSFELKLKKIIEKTLDDKSARDVVSIDLAGKSDIADYMIIATGTSSTHVGALSQHIVEAFKKAGIEGASAEGRPHNDWVLIDTPYIVVHIFQPQVRSYYNLEKMWQPDFSTSRQPEYVY